MGSTTFCRGLIIFIFSLWFTAFSLKAQPVANFNINLPVPNCNPAVYTFADSSTGVAPLSYQWNFGVYPGVNSIFQNPSTTFLNCGTYSVQLIITDGNGDADTSTQSVTVWCSPTANFSTSDVSGCIPYPVTFNSTGSIAGSGSLTNYDWDFGDGYSGTGASPNHSYVDAGCKQVTLIVTNSYDCVADTTMTDLLCVYTPPQADFTSTVPTSCSAPFVVTYSDSSSSGLAPFTYEWIFYGGDPATDTSASPIVTYNTPGNYSTTLIITDANGCTDTITYDDYVVIANNTADMTLSAIQGCPPLNISLSGIASSTPLGYSWSITPSGSISNSTSQNASVLISDTGTFSICLDIDFGSGCFATNCSTVVTHTPPNAFYSIDGLLNTCLRPNPISFIDSSTGSNLSYAWSFSGGSPASANTSSPDTINYVACGTYSASLLVTDDFGCTDSYSTPNFLTITCPVANFDADPTSGCVPLSVNFNSTSSTNNPVSWFWDFGDPSSGAANTSTSQNPSHTYNNPGCYTISLITTNAEGCKDTVIMPNEVCAGTLPATAFTATPTVNCANQPIYFTNQSTGTYSYTTYTWDFHGVPNYNNESNQQNPTYTYNDTGFFDVTLIVSNYGCNDTLTIADMVYLYPPVADATLSRTCAFPYIVTLDGTSSLGAQTYTWIIPGGNPPVAFSPIVSVTYTISGNYTATLFVTNDSTGCTDQLNVSIPIRDVEANFTGTPLSGCAPLTSCMTNTSVDAVSYAWLVTNSSGTTVATSTSTNPCFTLTAPGIYSVRLIATDMFGCKDTLLRPSYITVYAPVVDFSGLPLEGCSPLTVDFTDLTTSPTSTPVSWSWNFGDPTSGINNTSTLQNPSHTYNLSGYYTVTLSVTDDQGCTKTKTITNYIQVIHPEASFILTDTTVCQGTTACFINTSAGTGLTYDWDFGNGNTSTSSNPCYTYTVNGFYDITLIATDMYGCIDTISINDYVNVTKPTANLVADTLGSTCPPLLVQFTNLSADVDSSSTYYWQFGDGQVSSAPNPSHIYNIAGTFDVTLYVTNQNGCKDTIVFNDYITIGGPEGFINGLPTSGCVSHFTCFEATSPTTISFTWNFGDGAVEVGGDSICHTYTSTGTFYSELILNDGVGCVYAIPVGVVVVNGANCDFNLDNPFLCDNGTTQFTDASYGTSPVATWDWNFDDTASGAQNTSSLENPSHFFASPGTYSVTLNITTVDGCTNSHVDTVIVQSAPVVYFARIDSSVCAPDTIHFYDQTVSASPIENWYWNFDDPTSGVLNTDTLQNTLHFYQFPGTYNVTLTVVAENGCSDVITLPVYVHDTVIANACPDQIICSGSSALLTASGGATYSWSPTTGLSNPNVSSPIASPTITTSYTVTISNIYGCFDLDSTVVTVNPLPVVASLTANADTCADNQAQAWVVASNGTPSYTYSWNTNPIQTTDAVINLHGGNTNTVIITDANGCTVSQSIYIIDLEEPDADASDNNSTCGYSNGNAWVTVSGGNGGNTYLWNTGATTSSISNLPAGNYEVTVTDQFGCSDDDDTNINNIAGPTATIAANNTTCGNSNSFVNLIPSGGTNPLTYNWSSGATTQDLTNMSAGTYTVTVTDANSCTAIDSTTFINILGPTISFTQIDATCQLDNASIDVTITNGTAPFIYNWNGFVYTTEDLANIPSGNYNLTVTDANSCTDVLNVIITDTQIPILTNTSSNSTCGNNNGSIDLTVTGGATPYTFLWSNGETTEDVDSILAGTYEVTVTGSNGCTVLSIINVNDLTAPALTITPTHNTCTLDNGSIDLSLSGGTPSFSYLWSNGETTQDLSNLVIGTYLVTVTDGNGCLAFENATLINIPGQTLSSTADSSTCGNSNGAIDLNTIGGTAPYFYSWTNGATTEDLNSVVAGVYSVTVTDANACTAVETQTINNVDGPAISSTTVNSTCGNNNGSIDITVSGGTAPYAFDWNSGAFTSEDLTNIPSGIYTVIVTDLNNCTINSIITLNNTAGPILSAINSNTTCGSANGIIDLTVIGGTSPYTFDWNSGTYFTEDISNLTIGTYTVVVTDSNLCEATITEIIIDVAGPTASAVASDVTCSANNGTVTLTVVDGTAPFTFMWSNSATTQNLNGLTTGIYDVTITDANLCTTTASAIVSDVPGPFSAMATSSATCGNNNGSIDLDVTAGIAPYNYTWSNGATTQDVSGLVIGWYYATITDQNFCVLYDSAEVVNINGPSLVISSIDETCGSTNGQVYLSVNNGTSPYTFNWSNGATTQNLNYIVAGNYSVTVTDANNCSDISSASIINIPGPTAITLGSQNSVCGNNNGSVWVEVTGGTAPYSYLWNTAPAQANDTAYNLVGGSSYSVTVTDSNACVITGTIALTNIDGPSSSIIQTNCTCGEFNGAADLTVSAGTAPYSFIWSNGETTEDIDSLQFGTYSVTITDANGCTSISSTNVLDIFGPYITYTAINTTCGNPNGSIDVTVLGGTAPFFYNWNSGQFATQDLLNLAAGSFTLELADAAGCQVDSTIILIDVPGPIVNATSTPSTCGFNNGNALATVVGGSTPFSYSWSNASIDSFATNLLAGTYSLQVSDSNGCVANDTTTLVNIAGPTLSLSYSDATCGLNNAMIDLTVTSGTAPYTYDWNTGIYFTEDLNNLGAGLYYVVVIDSNTCQEIAMQNITAAPAPIMASVVSNATCSNANGTIDVTVTSGTAPYNFYWNNGSTTEDLNNLVAGNYFITVTDGAGCVLIDSFTVTGSTQPTLALTSTNANCGINDGAIDLTITGGTLPIIINWSNGSTTEDLDSLGAGNYVVSLTDSFGCIASDSVIIIQNNGPELTINSTNESCTGNDGAVNIDISGGTLPLTILWSNGSTTEDISAVSAGTYFVTVSDANGCTAEATADVLPTTPPSISYISTNTNCGASNGTIEVSVFGGSYPLNYLWSNGATTQDLDSLVAGIYFITLTDAANCSVIDSITITDSPAPVAIVDSTFDAGCNNTGVIYVSVSGGISPYTYSWSNAATTEDINNLAAGTYTVIVTDSLGCTSTTNATINSSTPQIVSSIASNESCNNANGTITLTVIGGTSPFTYNWNNGATTANISSLTANNYSVTVTDSLGCAVTLSETVNNNSGSALSLATTNSTCDLSNGTIDLTISGGTSPFTILWSSGSTDEDISGLAVGNYSVTVTDINLCTSTATATINTIPVMNLNYSTTNAICANANGAINLTVTSGTSPYTYAWSNGATTQDLSGVVAGIYDLTVTDFSGCQIDTAFTINSTSNFTMTLNAGTSVCQTPTGTINVVLNGSGTAPYQYYWSHDTAYHDDHSNWLVPGLYTITAVDASGCTVTNSIVVGMQGGSPNAGINYTGNVCENQGSVTFSHQGGTSQLDSIHWYLGNGAMGNWTPYTYTYTAPGTYTVTEVVYKGFCTDTATVTVTIYPGPVANGNTLDPICNPLNSGNIDLNISGGTNPLSYQWSNGSTSQDLSNINAGNYSVTVIDANGCTVAASYNLTAPISPVAVTTTTLALCALPSGTVDLTVSNGSSPYTYSWSNGETTEDLLNVLSGNYNVIVTDQSGCTVNANSIVSGTTGLTLNAVATNTSCGLINGSIDVTVSGGTSPYSYSWNTGETISDLNNLLDGLYDVTVTDANGCQSIGSWIINPSTILIAAISNVIEPSCISGGVIVIDVAGGTIPYTYIWSNGATTEDQTGLSGGNYSLTVIDAYGCTSTVNSVLTSPVPPVSSVIITNSNCSLGNGAIDLSVSGGASPYTYFWSTGSTNQDLDSLYPATYTVYVTDSAGCADSVVAIINTTVGPALTGILTQPGCYGTYGSVTVSATGGTSPYNYLWSTGDTVNNISSLSLGGYSVTVIDNNGCQDIESFVVDSSNSEILIDSLVNDATCLNSNGAIDITVSGGISPYTYSWSNAATTEDITNLSAGTYTVIVTDLLGCTTSTNATINNSIPQTLSLTATNESCNNSNGTITLTVTGGTSPFTYTWSNGATTQDLTNLSAGNYDVTVTDSLGCVATTTATITNSILPTIAMIATNANCNQADGSINLTVAGGTSPFSYSWSSGSTTEDISSLAIGTYVVTVTDVLGCSVIDSISISSTSAPVLALSMTNANCNQADGTIDLTISGGVSPYTIAWSNSATTEDLNGAGAGNYTVVVNDIMGCSVTNSISVGNNNGPSITTTSVDASCLNNNGSVDITISGGATPYTYAWSNGSTTADVLNLSSGSYSVTVTDSTGCQVLSTSLINAASTPVSSLIATDANCNQNNGAVNLTVSNGSAPYTYLWSNGATTQNIASLTSTNYLVTITDASGCIISDSISVGNLNGPSLTSTSIQSTCGNANGSVSLNVTGGILPYTYNWSNGSTTANISSLTANSYSVTVTDASGCSLIDSFTITTTVAPTLALSMNNSNCGIANGTIDLTISSGVSPYSILWNNGNTNEDLSALTSGNYSVTVTDVVGCTATGSITVGNNLAPTLSATITNETCLNSDGAIDVATSGGTSPFIYLWNNGSTSEDLTSLTAGNYTVTATDINGCTASTSATIISSPTSPIATLIASTANCNQSNGQINLSVSSGTAPYIFSWSTGQTTEDISNLAAGNYIVTITDVMGCAIQDSIFVGNTNGPVITSTMIQSTCEIANGSISITVTGGTLPYTYNWSNGATTQNISSLTANSYSVTVSDAAGCLAFDLIIINTTTLPVSVAAMTNANCNQNDGSVDLTITNGTAPFIYSWSNGATTQNISSLTANSYFVTITDVYGCSTTDSIIVGDNQGPELSVAPLDATCTNDNGSIDISISGGVSPFSFVWNNGATTEDLIGLSAGNYFVTVTDTNGCTANANATILSAPSPFASAISTSTNCNNANGAINLTVTNGFAPYTYLWNNGETTQDIDSIVAGNYSVSITDVAGCVITNSSVVGNISGPAITASLIQSTCENANGAIDITISGGVLPFTFIWNTSSSNDDLINIVAGNYSITVTDASGCVAINSFTINTTPLPVASLTAVNANCAQADGSVDLTISGGTAPYSVVWNNGATTQDLNNVMAGFYSVIVSDVNGCVASDTIAVDNNNGPSATYTTINSSCGNNNGSLDLTVVGGTAPYNYIWSNGLTTEDISSLLLGNYLVTVTDASGCNAYTLVSILTTPLPVAAFITTPSNCNQGNGAIDLIASVGASPYTYLWNNGATTENIDSVVTGIYSVTITDSLGCVGTDSVAVNNLNGPAISLLTTQPSCSSMMGAIDASATGSVPPYTYNWSNGATTQNIDSLFSGYYYVTVTDAIGCQSYDTTIINDLSTPYIELDLVTNVNCSTTGSIAITMSGGNAPYTFVWSNGSTTEDLNNLFTGNYALTVTDNSGCTDTISAIINGAFAQTISLTAVPSNCNISNGSVDLTVVGGIAPYNFVWNNGSTTEDLDSLVAGFYTATVTDAQGCVAIYSIVVGNIAGPVAISIIVQPTCLIATGSVDLSVTGGNAPYTFVWNNSSTTEDLNSVSGGIYSVTITDAIGCQTFGTYSLIGISPINLVVNAVAPICQGDSALLIATGAVTYSWTPSFGLSSTTDSSVYASPSVSMTYIVTGFDSLGCLDTASVVVNVNPLPTISASSFNSTLCYGDSTLIVVNGGSAYTWSPSTGINFISNDSVFVQPIASTTYTITGTDLFGCSSSSTIAVGVMPQIAMVVSSPDTSLCFGEFTILSATGADTYTWSPSSSLNSSSGAFVIASPTVTTTYYLTGYDLNGCSATDSLIVIVHPPVVIAVNPMNPTICAGSSVNLMAIGAVTYEWSPSTGLNATTGSLVIATPSITTTYIVTGTDSFGCVGFNAVIVSIGTSLSLNLNNSAPVICEGTATTLIVGGVLNATYSWTPSVTFLDTTGMTVSVNPATNSTYTVIATDQYGCTGTTTATVTVNATPTINANNASVCFGTSSTLTVIGAVNYSWSPSTGLSNTSGDTQIAAPDSTTTYTIIGIDSLGCADTTQSVVTVNPLPVLTATPSTNSICNGSSAIINVSGAATYQWTPSTGLSADTGSVVSALPLVTTTYTIFGTDTTGCTNSVTAIVNVGAPVTIVNTPMNPSLCFGDSIVISLAGAIDYLWTPSTGLNTSTGAVVVANPTVTTSYTVVGTDINGCTGSVVINIIINPLPIVTGMNATICAGQSTTLSTSGAYLYMWVADLTLSGYYDSTTVATPLTTTTYSLTGMNIYGCMDTALFVVNVNPLPNVSIDGLDPTYCIASGADSFTVSPMGGTLTGVGLVGNTFDPSLVGIGGPYYLTYTYTDSLGCSNTDIDTTSVNNNAFISASSSNAIICNSSSTTLSVIGGVTYSWSPSTGLNNTTGASVIATPTVTTTYFVNGINAAGCFGADSVIVNVAPPVQLAIVAFADSICAGSSTLISVNGGMNYTWSPAVNSSNANGDTVNVSPITTTTYTVTGIDVNGCSADTIVVVNIIPQPIVTVNSASVCSGDAAILVAQGATTYNWISLASTNDSVTVQPIVSTSYTVIGYTSTCSDTAIAIVSMVTPPVVSVNNATTCSGIAATLIANGASTYTWMPGNLNGTSVSVSPNTTTTYTAIGNNGSCADTAMAVVIVNASPVATLSGLNNSYCTNNPADTLIGIPAGGIFSGVGVNGNIFYPSQVTGSSTTVTYTYTDSLSCSAIDTQTVTMNGGGVIIVNPASSTICNSTSAIITASGAITYSWAPSTGLNTTTGDQVVASPSVNTTYTVTGTTASGCVAQTTSEIIIAPNIFVNVIASNDSICLGQTISMTATGGLSYSWSPSTFLSSTIGNTVSASPSSNITYTVVATGAAGCSGQTIVPITLLPNPIVTVSTDTICVGQFATLVASGAANYHWSTNALGNTISVNPTTTTAYSVVGMNGVCADTATTFVTVNPLPVINTISSGNFICNGGTVQINASGASTYVWTPSTGLNTTIGSTVTASLTTSTTYTVSGIDMNGCANTQSVPVNVALPVIITTNSSDTSICIGESVELNVNGANNFTWSPSTGLSGTNGTSVTANPTVTTTYTVTGTDINGCTAVSLITVNVNPLPVIIASSTSATLCTSASATLSATGAANYFWSPSVGLSSTTGNSIQAQPNSSVTYTVTGIDSFGCAATSSVNIIVYPVPAISITSANPTICFGASATLNASGASTYSWSPSTNLNSTNTPSVIANPTTTTTYTVNAIDVNGCSATATSIITVQPLPVLVATALDSTLCVGQSTILSVSGALNYIWSPSVSLSSATGSFVTANPAGNTTYQIIGTDNLGCQSTTLIPVIINPIASVVIPTIPAICPGEFATLVATGAVNYLWSTNALGDSIAVNPVVNTTYSVTGTDANGCTATATSIVTINPVPTISAVSSQNNFCVGQTAILTANGTVSYTWTPSISLSSSTGNTVTANPTGTTTYTIVGTNSFGCTNTTEIEIVVYQLPMAAAGPDADLCEGEFAQLSASGGTTYEWTPQTGLDNPYISNPMAAPSTSMSYIVNVGNQNGCYASDTINVTIHMKPNVNAGPSHTVCYPYSALLQGDGAAFYNWTPSLYLDDSTLQEPTCTPQFDITYTLTVSDSFGCSASDTVSVKVKLPFTITADPDITMCRNNAAQLNAFGGNNYLWTPTAGLDNPYVPNPIASPSVTTTYIVTSTDGVCYMSTDTVVVTINQLPIVYAGADADLLYGSTYQLYGFANGGTIEWTPSDFLSCTDCFNPIVNHLNTPMTYTLTVTDSLGCRAEDDVRISLTCDEDLVYVPNAFTPNGDHKNDIFRIRTYGLSEVKAFRVFNRWGEMVFETYDVSVGWDGSWQGEACAPAVFVYYLEGTCANGQEVLKKGNVTLIR